MQHLVLPDSTQRERETLCKCKRLASAVGSEDVRRWGVGKKPYIPGLQEDMCAPMDCPVDCQWSAGALN